jgi:hypothetical protein
MDAFTQQCIDDGIILNPSELAQAMLDWEQKRAELDAIEAKIKGTVMQMQKTYTVGNVRATFSQGRKTYDYEEAAQKYSYIRANFSEVVEKHKSWKVDWKSVCDEIEVEDIPFDQGAPSVTLKIT